MSWESRFVDGRGNQPSSPVPVILGATGSGKTTVAVRLARELGGEVIVADSRQVYRGLDVGSNKPSAVDREGVRFHLLGIADLQQTFNAFDFVQCASRAIGDVLQRAGTPIVEGGSLLYVRALCQGFNLAGVPPNPSRRQELESLTTEQLVSRLRVLDPSARVDEANRVRVLRAIEILEGAGAPLERSQQRHPPRWRFLKIGLRLSLAEIDHRLAERTREQLAAGLVNEVKDALAHGVDPQSPALAGVGAADVLRHLRGEISAEELESHVLRSNRRLARRQLRWLNRDPEVAWFEAEAAPVPPILEYLRERLSERDRRKEPA